MQNMNAKVAIILCNIFSTVLNVSELSAKSAGMILLEPAKNAPRSSSTGPSDKEWKLLSSMS
jgi:hypothetical protein